MRPAWLCRNCAAPWPCAPARLRLSTEFYGHSIALAFYLAANLQDAVDDLYSLGVRPEPQALHARFLGWLSLTRLRRPRDEGHYRRAGHPSRPLPRCGVSPT
ncbi:hypothetical protein [Micromonospora arborensis]|uniref:hypothetical protein n=1 Tax=Micromonospora arborensis TaxID=2116518 RepID=UPI00371839C8